MFTNTDRDSLQCIHAEVNKISDRTFGRISDLFDRNKKLENEILDLKYENGALKTKVDLYEKFIAKMLESDPDKSNDIFMFDGDIYRLTDYHKDGGAGKPTTLTVEFRCVTGITKNFKENGDE